MAKILISTGINELVEAGRRFGSEWARLREFLKKRGEKTEKWFDNMIIKLDSPTADGFHRIIRKMVRTFYDYQEAGFKWNISSEVLSLLSDKSKISWRHAFMTGVFFGYYGYFEKSEEKEVKDE
jgi:pyruvate carboxylase